MARRRVPKQGYVYNVWIGGRKGAWVDTLSEARALRKLLKRQKRGYAVITRYPLFKNCIRDLEVNIDKPALYVGGHWRHGMASPA